MTRLALILLLIGTPVAAQQFSSSWFIPHETSGTANNILSIAPSEQANLYIRFGPDPESEVTVKHDGTIEYGEHYKPDAAAKAFWDAVGVERKARGCQ
jgi:hypothetical protein